MKLWQSILLTIFIIFIFIVLGIDSNIIKLIILISAVFSYFDAKNMEIKNYKSFFATKPWHVALGMFLLWAIYFPWWLSYRYKITHGQASIKSIDDNKKI